MPRAQRGCPTRTYFPLTACFSSPRIASFEHRFKLVRGETGDSSIGYFSFYRFTLILIRFFFVKSYGSCSSNEIRFNRVSPNVIIIQLISVLIPLFPSAKSTAPTLAALWGTARCKTAISPEDFE